MTDGYEPSGDHIPFLLERLVQEQPDSPETKSVLEALSTFGEESGLFKRIDVRKLGSKPDDPFQLLVTMEGRAANVIDVGYGISQALPVIVQSVLVDRDNLLLLQQPEVHLHPRAQAALGSFFSRLVAKAHKQLVIETHSDFIIDRIRQHVARGDIRAADVAILFLERAKAETRLHVISLDAAGNILNAPTSYRDFFIQEEWRLLTRAP
jgi:predicted ATPase